MTATAPPAAPPRLQRVIPIASPWFLPVSLLESPVDWPAVFGRQAPLALEIGCGTGHFITEMAARHPDGDFLAIDIYNKGCLKTCRKLEASGLTNVRVMRVEARELLLRAVPDAALRVIYINCPDPWPKQRHRARRLVNRAFLELALCRLAPAGEICFSSDQRDYAEQVAATLAELPAFGNLLDAPMVTELPGYPLSKYMRRFLAQGQPIHFVRCRREPDRPLPGGLAPDLRQGYRSRRPGSLA